MKIRTLLLAALVGFFTSIALAQQQTEAAVLSKMASDIAANPNNTEQLVSSAIKANPGMEVAIVKAAIAAQPSKAVSITTTAVERRSRKRPGDQGCGGDCGPGFCRPDQCHRGSYCSSGLASDRRYRENHAQG